jgi:hypothetical protein
MTHGSRGDHRPALKPRRLGLTVTAEGGPVWGPLPEGHPSDRTEPRFPSTQRRQHLPDLGAPRLVADRQGFAGETMAVAHRCRLVPLVPPTVSLRQELVDSPARQALPLVWEQPGRPHGEREQYRGASVVWPSRWQPATGAVEAWPWRWLVVEATPLAKAKASRLTAAQQAEQARLATLHQPWPRRPWACEAAAQQAAAVGRRARRLHHHHLPSTVSPEWVPTKRPTRGRPPKEVPRPQRQAWRVTWQVPAAAEAISQRAPRERRLVLATTVLEVQQLSATELRRADKGPPAAERRFTWAKNPAAIAPIFL